MLELIVVVVERGLCPIPFLFLFLHVPKNTQHPRTDKQRHLLLLDSSVCPTPPPRSKQALLLHTDVSHIFLSLSFLVLDFGHRHRDNTTRPLRRSIIIIMADEKSTPPPPAAPAPAPSAATVAATASSWFGSLGADIGKAFETAREQVVKAAEVC